MFDVFPCPMIILRYRARCYPQKPTRAFVKSCRYFCVTFAKIRTQQKPAELRIVMSHNIPLSIARFLTCFRTDEWIDKANLCCEFSTAIPNMYRYWTISILINYVVGFPQQFLTFIDIEPFPSWSNYVVVFSQQFLKFIDIEPFPSW